MGRQIDRAQYFQLSHEKGESGRCPILDVCERRIQSLWACQMHHNAPRSNYDNFLAKYKSGLRPQDEDYFHRNFVRVQSDAPALIGGDTAYSISGLCPEVGLFESGNVPLDTKGMAVTEASWDKYFPDGDQSVITECGHYTECPEYSHWKSRREKEKLETINLGEVKFSLFGFTVDLAPLIRTIAKWAKTQRNRKHGSV